MAQSDHEYGSRLIARLRDKKEGLGYNNIQFAAYLGVHHEVWRSAAAGNRRLGPTLANAAVQRFPDLFEIWQQFTLAYRVRIRTGEVRKRRVVRTGTVEVATVEREEVAG